jgi:hypothetical protein
MSSPWASARHAPLSLTSEFLRRLSLSPPNPVDIVRRMRETSNDNDAEWMQLSTSSHQFHLECAAAGISYSEIGGEIAIIFNHLNGTGAAPDVAVPLHSLSYPTAREQSGLVRAAAATQTATFQRAFELLHSDPIAFVRWVRGAKREPCAYSNCTRKITSGAMPSNDHSSRVSFGS